MTKARRIRRFLLVVLAITAVLALGSWIEYEIVEALDVSSITPRLSQVGIFFGVLNLNLLLLAVAIFLVLRAAVKLAIDRKKGVFGSSLRTKLVTSFVFFAVLPTIILIYMTSKFVGANFDKWMPSGIVEVTQKSARSERSYQELASRGLAALQLQNLTSGSLPSAADFVYNEKLKSLLIHPDFENLRPTLLTQIQREQPRLNERSKVLWLPQTSERPISVALRNVEGRFIVGIVAPPPIHSSWNLLSNELETTAPGIELLRLSYYIMLGVLSLLIVFSATWLGFTIAREFSGPLLALAQAADRVAQGDYRLEIDEFVSDDEMGLLAQSFRSMVHDLREASEKANASATELALKAQVIEANSHYNALLIKHVNSGVIVITKDGLIEAWNDQAEQIFDRSPAQTLGFAAEKAIDVDFFDAILRPVCDEIALRKSDGTWGMDGSSKIQRIHSRASFRGAIEGREKNLQVTIAELDTESILVLLEDLTELERAQRVAAWRDVARRVAHEIKNPLTPINLGVQRIQRRFSSRLEGKDLEVFQDSIRIVLDSTASIRRLVEEFNKFARMPQALMTSGSLIDAVQLALEGFSGSDGQVVSFAVREQISEQHDATTVPSSDWAAFGRLNHATFDKDQIVRLVSNLVANALEACDEDREKVTVEVIYRIHESICELSVVDNGPGIPKQLRGKIFEPYFSTRRRGSGLGLPIVRQIAAEHSGEIVVLDHHPSGVEFRVTLPVLHRDKRILQDQRNNLDWTDV
jgi:two-component system nitrogen regulation sensor histidine kinase NtrY